MGSQTSTTRQQPYDLPPPVATHNTPMSNAAQFRPAPNGPDSASHGGATARSAGGNWGRAGGRTSPPSGDEGRDEKTDPKGGGRSPPQSTAVAASPSPGNSSSTVPCVFSWTHGGHSVYVTGTFNNWSVDQKIRLIRSGHEFSVIRDLPRGVHLYKFIVDDQWKYAPDQETQCDDRGNVNNVLDISNYRHYNFRVPTDYEQARHTAFHEYIPDPSEYTGDAPTIPILLSKSTCVAADPPPRAAIPLHCVSNHLYHDAHASNIFGPQISSVAATQRWRCDQQTAAAGQRYATIVYLTMNPLFSFPDGNATDFAPNCLKSVLVQPAQMPPEQRKQQTTDMPSSVPASASTDDQPSSGSYVTAPGGASTPTVQEE